jgi:hypothetical protein
VFRVGRGAVLADRGARAIGVVEPIVAVGAQAAELAEPERGVVPPMRLDMVADGRWRDAASLQANPTQRLDHELMRSAALPASGAVPAVDIRTVRHRGNTFRPIKFCALLDCDGAHRDRRLDARGR